MVVVVVEVPRVDVDPTFDVFGYHVPASCSTFTVARLEECTKSDLISSNGLEMWKIAKDPLM